MPALIGARRQFMGQSGNQILDLNFVSGQYRGGSLSSNLSLTRSSPGITSNAAGALFSFASGEFRIKDLGIKVDPTRVNKCTNFNANPTDLTNVTKGGDAAATLTVVDDTAALLAAGLQNIATSGKVYKLDNSAGVASAYVTFNGQVGNTNTHISSIYGRRTSGSGTDLFGLNSQQGTWTLTSAYTRSSISNLPGASTRQFQLIINASDVVYFTLNQLEEGSFATPVIEVAGASATRQADNILFTGAADSIARSAQGWAVVEIGTGSYEASAFLLGGAGASDYYLRQGSGGNTTVQGRFGGATNTAATIGGGGVIGTNIIKAGITWNGAGFDICANNGTVASLAQSPVTPSGVYFGGRNGSSVSSLHFRRLTMGRTYLGTGIAAKTV